MTAVLLGLAWSSVLVAAGACSPRGRSRPARLDALTGGCSTAGRRRVVPLEAAAACVRAAIAAAAAPWRTRRAQLRSEAALHAVLPHVVDLLSVAVGAGCNVRLAVSAVAPRGPDPIGPALVDVLRDVALGRRLGDALSELPGRLGEPVRPVVEALVDAERYGVPLAPTLERLAAHQRLLAQRRAETAARRAPVALLFPLVVCILPAFALLTVVPLVAGGLRSLRL